MFAQPGSVHLAASGGVHDHEIDARERARVATREPARRVEASVVRRERSKAALLTGHDHAPAVTDSLNSLTTGDGVIIVDT